MHSSPTNLIERLENLIASLEDASDRHVYTFPVPDEDNNKGRAEFVQQRIDDALGIAGEILTMIDGR